MVFRLGVNNWGISLQYELYINRILYLSLYASIWDYNFM